MHKRTIWILIAAAAVIAAACILFLPRHYEPVTVADDLYFGMSPLEVRSRFGQPDNIEESALAPEMTYTYSEAFCGQPAVFCYSFVRSTFRKELSTATVRVEAPDGDPDALYEQMSELCRKEYISYSEALDTNTTVFETSDGAACVECRIVKEPSSVLVTIIKVW